MITPIPAWPTRGTIDEIYVPAADATMVALGQMVTELNAMGTAYNLATTTTSASSVLIGTGSKSFTVATGLGFVIGMAVSMASTASPANNMFGTVTSYNSGTGALVVSVTTTNGSGTLSAWTIALAAASSGASLANNTFTGVQNFAMGSGIASAATINLTAATGNTVNVTGSVGISTVTLGAGMSRLVIFTGSPLLNYNSVTHNLNSGGANIQASAGDMCLYFGDGTTVRGIFLKANGNSSGNVGEIFDWPYPSAPSYGLLCNGASVSSSTYSSLFAKAVKSAAVTMTIATPVVISWASHPLYVNAPVKFTTTGALPTGITAGTTYYVISAGFGANSFQISATIGGAAINTSGTQSGVHTAIHAVHGCANDLLTFNLPNIPAGYTTVQANANEGRTTIGQMPAHTHSGYNGGGGTTIDPGFGMARDTGDTGTAGSGTDNLAAGLNVRKYIRF